MDTEGLFCGPSFAVTMLLSSLLELQPWNAEAKYHFTFSPFYRKTVDFLPLAPSNEDGSRVCSWVAWGAVWTALTAFLKLFGCIPPFPLFIHVLFNCWRENDWAPMPVLFCEVEFICLTCSVLFLWIAVVFSLPCSINFCTLLCILWSCSICHLFSSLLEMNSCLLRVSLCHCICCRNMWFLDTGTVHWPCSVSLLVLNACLV